MLGNVILATGARFSHLSYFQFSWSIYETSLNFQSQLLAFESWCNAPSVKSPWKVNFKERMRLGHWLELAFSVFHQSFDIVL